MTGDVRHLRLAFEVARIFSKDPSTKVGAVVLGDQPNQLAIGYNGLPPGLRDDERLLDRQWKLAHTLHAERNALANVAGFTPRVIFVTHHPCRDCALEILAARTVRHVITCEPSGKFKERWAEGIEQAAAVFEEAGVSVKVVRREVVEGTKPLVQP